MRSFSYKHLAYYRLLNYEIHKIMFNVSKNCLLHKHSCVTHECLKSFMGTSKFALFKRNFYRTHSVRLSNTDSNSSTLNPIEELQKFVAVPVLQEKDHVFTPSREEILEGQKLFIPSVNNKITFLKSALLTEQLPEHDLPEVAFIGRSNVGKSSLIKTMLENADEDVRVRCSKTPGHTKLMNFFQVGKYFAMVDMPGYGHRMPQHYTDSVENFLATRKNLKMTFVLVDGKVGLKPVDEQHLYKVNEFSANICIVMTKIDKTKSANVLKQLMMVQKYMKQLPHCLPQPFLVSAHTGDGIAMLQAFIAYMTGNLQLQAQ